MSEPTPEQSKPSRRRRRPKGAPTHALELPLLVTESDRRQLGLRMKAAGILRNLCTGEALRRLDLMHGHASYALAGAIAKDKDQKAERTAAYAACRSTFDFSKTSMEAFARHERDKFWIRDHLGGHDTQTVAADAFHAVERHAFGKGGRPHFKPVAEIRSIASKDNHSFMRLKGRSEDGPDSYTFEFRDLRLKVRRRRFSDSELHSLSMPALSYRLVRHRDTARERFACQVVVDGPARQHRERCEGKVALDVGVKTIAVVSRDDAMLETFCPDVVHPYAEIRRIQRGLDRSIRASNPDCFAEDGSYIKGRKIKKRSKRWLKGKKQLQRRQAKLARQRRNAHGQVTNRILGQGTTIHAEKVSHVAFQRSFGRSVQVRAPGTMFAMLGRKAEAAGGGIVSIPTWVAKLSQFDHTTGDCVRKPLSLRRHAMRDGSGVVVQRDVYSAFLALHADATGTVDVDSAKGHWEAGACERLAAVSLTPGSGDAEPASGRGFPLPPAASPLGDESRRSRSPRRVAAPALRACRKARLGGEASAGSRSSGSGHLAWRESS